MKWIISNLAVLVLILGSCDNREEEVISIDCNVEISQNPDWNTENFKSNFTIQFPDDYEGQGMVGFEGNVFQKRRIDRKVLFIYGYCSETYCEDFGAPLAEPFPNAIIAKDPDGKDVALDSREVFCLNGDIVGILYYNTEEDAVGKYFMKQGTEFLEGLTIDFTNKEYQEVETIIRTIAENED